MSELLITSSLDSIEEGQVFSKNLPRHVTIWQYFELPDLYIDTFIADASDAITGFPPLQIEGSDYAELGPEHNVPVRRVRALGSGATLITLHTVLGTIIERYEGTVKNPEWAYQGYNPHITYVDGRALGEGERAVLRTVELIEKNPISREKIVRNVWKLEEA